MNKVLLEVQHLYKSFDAKIIHQDLSFDLYEGESLGLLGKSGTGKSVLLRSLIGLEQIDQGSIKFKGQELSNLKEEMLFPFRTEISYAFQSGALFDSMNVYENLAYPLREHRPHMSENEIKTMIDELLTLVHMQNTQDLMPSELSGGMQKRVGLARSVILNPAIMLYDEPTAGLDPKNIQNIIEIMKDFQSTRKISSIFVTHDLPAAMEVCNRILVLNHHKIYFSGTPSELRASDDPFIKDFLIYNS